MAKKNQIDGVRVYCKFDKLVNLAELKPNPDNPNTHPDEQIDLLSKIIVKNGWRDRITVSNRSGLIVKGHGRFMAAIRAGLSKAPVEFQDYDSAAQEAADLIADNKIAEFSLIDDEAARALMDSFKKNEDFTPDDFGFTLDEFAGGAADHGGRGRQAGSKAEIEFTMELAESSNYIVLVFDNDIDWLQAQQFFGLKTVKALDSKPGFQKQGVGRVINGAEVLLKIT